MDAPQAVADYIRDAAFTSLNRFVALKMLEARGLLQECITKGEASSGYREFCGLAPGLLLLPDSGGYRLYIESLFDELSTEVKVLFDRRDTASALWPKRSTFGKLLEVLNSADLADVWGEDETIGWVYQFFNSKEERATMRDPKQGGSQAPRNSRELAIRNQFFTPRYVVQFLTDNTLGRIWYEMRDTKTALAGSLRVYGAQARRGVRAATEEGSARPSCARSGLRQWSLSALRVRPAPHHLRGGVRRSGQPGERSHGQGTCCRLPEPRRASEGRPCARPRTQPPRSRHRPAVRPNRAACSLDASTASVP